MFPLVHEFFLFLEKQLKKTNPSSKTSHQFKCTSLPLRNTPLETMELGNFHIIGPYNVTMGVFNIFVFFWTGLFQLKMMTQDAQELLSD